MNTNFPHRFDSEVDIIIRVIEPFLELFNKSKWKFSGVNPKMGNLVINDQWTLLQIEQFEKTPHFIVVDTW